MATLQAVIVGFIKLFQRKVSKPILICALFFALVVLVDIEIRKRCIHVDDSTRVHADEFPRNLPVGNVVGGDGNPSEEYAREKARIDEILAGVPEEQKGAGDAPNEPEQSPHGAGDRREGPEQPQRAADVNVHKGDRGDISEGELDALTQILEMRLAEARSEGIIGLRSCSLLASMNNTRGACVDTTCPHRFHPSAKTRIRQLLAPRFRLTPQQLDAVNALAKDVVPKKYIFVTAVSSNHFFESQALVFNLRHFIFPKLHPDTYSFLYFNLGLKPREKQLVEKNCNCTVMSINLKAFPSHTWKLMCYAWKPFIIRALLPKTEVLVYMDASVRFRDMDLNLFFATARRWGAQFLASQDSIPNHTVQSMFNFYQVPPCLFWPFPELLAGFSVFHNEPFMTKVVLEPWVSCAFNGTCMCPVDPHAFRICSRTERRVGGCHRFDLSSLTLQMAMLYGDKFGHLVMQDRNRPKVKRDDRMDFFRD